MLKDIALYVSFFDCPDAAYCKIDQETLEIIRKNFTKVGRFLEDEVFEVDAGAWIVVSDCVLNAKLDAISIWLMENASYYFEKEDGYDADADLEEDVDSLTDNLKLLKSAKVADLTNIFNRKWPNGEPWK